MEIILKDGVKYSLHTYNTEDYLEEIIFEHFKDVFGENSIILPKQKIKTRSGIGAIPDAFVLSVEEKKWYIVEVELKSHLLYEHIVPQMSKFNAAIKNIESQKKLIRAFYDEIKDDPVFQVKGIKEVYKYISETMESKPEIIIFIDERNNELDEVCESLPFSSKVIQFKTYSQEGVGIGDHIHKFESLVPVEGAPPTKKIEEVKKPIQVEIIDLINARYIRPSFVMYRTHKRETFKAEILSDGRIKILKDNLIVDSLSTAASHLTGTPTNGWIWWKYQDENGREHLIDELRKKYLQEGKQ